MHTQTWQSGLPVQLTSVGEEIHNKNPLRAQKKTTKNHAYEPEFNIQYRGKRSTLEEWGGGEELLPPAKKERKKRKRRPHTHTNPPKSKIKKNKNFFPFCV